MNTTEKNLEGKVAFITGGNRGIGLETALELGKLGAKVVIGVRNRAKGVEAVRQLLADGIHADVLALDLTNAEDLRGAYAYFDKQYGRLHSY